MPTTPEIPTRKFTIESSPHIISTNYKFKTMWLVIIALLPATIAGVYFFGLRALWIILASVATAMATEAFFAQRKHKPIFKEQSPAIITGLLLALIIPPTVPFWVPIIGSFFAIAIAKHAFGGAGMTIFNPALVGRAFLVASLPGIMSAYVAPFVVDGITSATPLSMLKHDGYAATIQSMGGQWNTYLTLLIGNHGGSIGETSAILLLLGGLFLIWKKLIDWRIPAIYIGTVFVLALAFRQDPIFQILSGGLFIGAFFMATAYEGMPITRWGRVIFALGCGIFTVMIRTFSGYPEGVNYSILLMNASFPIIERLTITKPFGRKSKTKRK